MFTAQALEVREERRGGGVIGVAVNGVAASKVLKLRCVVDQADAER